MNSSEEEDYGPNGSSLDISGEYTSEALKQILFLTDVLDEIAVHQLAFQLDYFATQNYDQRILDVEYTPDAHGVYSADVSLELHSLAEDDEIEARADLFQGDFRVVVYDRREEVPVEDDVGEVIDHFLSEAEPFDTQELIRRSKENEIRQRTDHRDNIDFR